MAMVFNDQGALVEVPDVMASPWESMGTPKPGTTKVKKTSQGATTSASDHASELEKLQMLRILNQEQNLMGQENRLNNMYGAAAANQQTNIRPLLQLTDSWTGSRLASNYQDPETAAQLRERLGNAEDKIQRRREAITDDQMNLIKARLMSEQQKSNNALRERLLGARLQASKEKQNNPHLTGEARGKVGAIMSALESVKSLESSMAKGLKPQYVDATTPYVVMFSSDNEYTIAARKLSDDIGRLRSGGAITQDEEARFMGMLPRPADKPDIAAKKISELRKEFSTRLQGFGLNNQNIAKVGFDPAQYGLGMQESQAQGRTYEEMSDAELEALLQGN